MVKTLSMTNLGAFMQLAAQQRQMVKAGKGGATRGRRHSNRRGDGAPVRKLDPPQLTNKEYPVITWGAPVKLGSMHQVDADTPYRGDQRVLQVPGLMSKRGRETIFIGNTLGPPYFDQTSRDRSSCYGENPKCTSFDMCPKDGDLSRLKTIRENRPGAFTAAQQKATCTDEALARIKELHTAHREMYNAMRTAHEHQNLAVRAQKFSLDVGEKLRELAEKHQLKGPLKPEQLTGLTRGAYGMLAPAGDGEIRYDKLKVPAQTEWYETLVNPEKLAMYIYTKEPAIKDKDEQERIRIAKDAADLVKRYRSYREDIGFHLEASAKQMELYQKTAESVAGKELPPVITPEKKRRWF